MTYLERVTNRNLSFTCNAKSCDYTYIFVNNCADDKICRSKHYQGVPEGW